MNRSEIADHIVLSDGREMLELLVGVALPQVSRIHDVQVAIENPESVTCHQGTLSVVRRRLSYTATAAR